jgi:DNA polymerase-3 subunit chi
VTQVDFYIHVDDKVQTAARIATKAYLQGHRLTVFCPETAAADRFDRVLWTAPATGFVPHCYANEAHAAATPIVIDRNGEPAFGDDILLNLHAERPPHFSRYRRLIEIVSCEEDDRRLARDRFKFYRDRGYDIRTHDLAKAGPA